MQIWNVSASFTRPADTTAYASGDLVANSTTAGSVTPMTFSLGNSFGIGQTRITRIRLHKTSTTTANASFRLHLYQPGTITFANGDNGAFSTDKSANYLGFFDIGAAGAIAFTDGVAIQGAAVAGSEMMIRTGSGNTLLGVLEARGAYTPTSGEVFTITLEDLAAY